mmetsp:Transcript_43876/g.108562  ORF Transcript_43876/g.108562 Transcript_43876/m.108562 type:complete len:118 (-) Transcript_43876:217-570(-)
MLQMTYEQCSHVHTTNTLRAAVEHSSARLDALRRFSTGPPPLLPSAPPQGGCGAQLGLAAVGLAHSLAAHLGLVHGGAHAAPRVPLADAGNVDGLLAQLRAERKGWHGMCQLLAEVD